MIHAIELTVANLQSWQPNGFATPSAAMSAFPFHKRKKTGSVVDGKARFQVVTDDSLNTPQSVDLGRFIIELRVAPSLPMRFLTIRLLQTSDRTQALEVI